MKRNLHTHYICQVLVGTVFLLSLIQFSACTKNLSGVPVLKSVTADTAITDTSIYIDITLNGERIFGVYDNRSNPWSWGELWAYNFVDSSIFEFNRLGLTATNYTGQLLFGFSLGDINFRSLSGDSSVFYKIPTHVIDSFFMPGNYIYSKKGQDTTFTLPNDSLVPPQTRTVLTSGTSIYYIDSTGKKWETFIGSADQTGSYFTITKNEPVFDAALANYSDDTFITAVFDCMLYDGNGNSMHLTNGKMRQEIYFAWQP